MIFNFNFRNANTNTINYTVFLTGQLYVKF